MYVYMNLLRVWLLQWRKNRKSLRTKTNILNTLEFGMSPDMRVLYRAGKVIALLHTLVHTYSIIEAT